MGREVRRVPADWQHPRDERGRLIPLYGRSYSEELRKWNEGNANWIEGLRQDWTTKDWVPIDEEHRNMSFSEWDGGQPQSEDYMPDWPEAERTHYQMYEVTSEGTPISPVFASPEELAKWLADNKASAFADQTATYEQWLGMIDEGYAISGVTTNGKIQSGVAAIGEQAFQRNRDWPDTIF